MAEKDECQRTWPRKILRVTLTGEYDGFWFDWWRNAPLGWRAEFWRGVRAGDDILALRALWRCIVDHNLVDWDGNPLPPGGELTDEQLAAIPEDLPALIWKSVQDAQREEHLPNAP